jgi:hypothetical protein
MKTLICLVLLCALSLIVPAAVAQNEPLRLEEGRIALTVSAPDGWVSTEAEFSATFPALALAPNESMLTPDILTGNEPPTLDAGDVMLIVTLVDNRSIPGADRTATLADAAQAWAENVGQNLGETSIEGDLIISGQDAALLSLDSRGFSLGYLLIDAGISETEGRRQFVTVLALTGPGELAGVRDTLLALAATISVYDDDVLRFGVEAASATEQGEMLTLEEDGLRMMLSIPSGWVQTDTRMFSSFPAAALAPNDAMLVPDVLQGSEPPVFESGHVMLLTTLAEAVDLSAPERDSDLETVVQNWAELFASSLGETSVDTQLQVGDLPAALVRVDTGGVEIGVLFVSVGSAPNQTESQFVMLLALTASGELDDSLDVVLEVAASVRVFDQGEPRLAAAVEEAAPAAPSITVGSHPLLELLSLLPPPSDEMLDNGNGLPLTVVHYLDLETLGTLDTDILAPYADSIFELYQADAVGMEDAIGISLAQIKRVLVYGLVPSRMYVLAGEFDAVVISEAMTELGFQVRTADNIASFCNPEGCDQAMSIDMAARNSGNPFGGNIGRREAIVLIKREGQDDLLIASPAADLVARTLAPFIGDEANTGDPDMLAAAAALLAASPDNPLVAAYITPSEWLDGANTVEGAELPPYSLAALGSYQGDPSTTVALLYGTAADAETAAASLPLRLDGEGSDGTYREAFEGREITIGEASTVALDGGQAAALLSFDSPEAADEAYRLVLQMVFRRDIGWLNAAGG